MIILDYSLTGQAAQPSACFAVGKERIGFQHLLREKTTKKTRYTIA